MKRKKKELASSSLYAKFVGARNIVIGCGTSGEVSFLASMFPKSYWVGIDLEIKAPIRGTNFEIVFGDAQKMEFSQEEFDFIYLFHVLEHVNDPSIVLRECERILKRQGHIYIGTPNRNRIIGYVTSGEGWQKFVRWNLQDYWMRMMGKWSNQSGAHAGFSSTELDGLVKASFSSVENLTHDYYSKVHKKHHKLIQIIRIIGISKYLFPSMYFLAKK